MYLRLHNILLDTSHLLKDDTTWTVIEGYLQQLMTTLIAKLFLI